ncbi:MAG: TatD family hydrolase, partial [Oscillospiraceae bacterium]|nr:TatD family hydrolase [Oscillospiraceae bacterium]
MLLFDAHAHLDDPRFDEDREAVIQDMRAQGMRCVCVGANMATSQAAVTLAARFPHLWAAVAVHPHDAKDIT